MFSNQLFSFHFMKENKLFSGVWHSLTFNNVLSMSMSMLMSMVMSLKGKKSINRWEWMRWCWWWSWMENCRPKNDCWISGSSNCHGFLACKPIFLSLLSVFYLSHHLSSLDTVYFSFFSLSSCQFVFPFRFFFPFFPSFLACNFTKVLNLSCFHFRLYSTRELFFFLFSFNYSLKF